jgi:hypothetical protein
VPLSVPYPRSILDISTLLGELPPPDLRVMLPIERIYFAAIRSYKFHREILSRMKGFSSTSSKVIEWGQPRKYVMLLMFERPTIRSETLKRDAEPAVLELDFNEHVLEGIEVFPDVFLKLSWRCTRRFLRR